MRALYGLVGSLLIGVIVSFLTKAESKEKMQGLVAGTLDKAKERYKEGPINEIVGKKAVAKIVEDKQIEEIAISLEAARMLSAGVGDLVHLSDARWWLGGLRSTQAKISLLHDQGSDVVFVAPALIKRGNLIVRRKHRLEKIL
jgi:SSS family solute:Na+ symporter